MARMMGRSMARSGALLGLFAIVASLLVAYTYEATKARIKENERLAVLRSLHQIIPPRLHDNDIFNDLIQVTEPDLLGSRHPQTVYRARKDGRPVAAILSTVAPDGYGGPIKMLVGIRYDGTLAGVRVISHRETPGLGDGIEVERSHWIRSFEGRSLADPPQKRWRVKKDGGVFDQFTGATITPRAVVKAVKNALIYFQRERKMLFETPAEPVPTDQLTQEIEHDGQ